MFSLEKGDEYVWRVFVNYTSDFDRNLGSLLLNTSPEVNADSWITKCMCC